MLFDLSRLSAANRYKLVASTVLPRPIAWVVSQDTGGTCNAAPYSFFNAFSASPPILGIGIGGRDGGGPKDTLDNIRALGEFVVCLVPEALAAAMALTAEPFAPEVDELERAGLETAASTRVAPPRIAASPVAFECRLHQEVRLGTQQTLVLGEVMVMHVRDDIVLDAERCHIDTDGIGLVGRWAAGRYLHTADSFDVSPQPRSAA